MEYFNQKRVMKRMKGEEFGWLRHFPVEMVEIHGLRVVSAESQTITLGVMYRWKNRDNTYSRNGEGVAVVEKVGDSYKVLAFETDGAIY